MARLLALSDVSKPSHSHTTVPSPPKITQYGARRYPQMGQASLIIPKRPFISQGTWPRPYTSAARAGLIFRTSAA